MKLKKIIAAVAAAAVAVSTMAVSAFAIDKGDYFADGTLYLVADDGKPQWAIDNNVDITTIYGVKMYCGFNADEIANESTWIGGGIGANSPSTGWKSIEWGRNEKEIIADLANGTVTWQSTDPIFKADDKYAHLWIQAWGGTVSFDKVEILDKDGNVITGSEAAPAETEAAETEAAPEETTEAAPEETTAPVEEEAVPAEEEAEDEDVDVDVDEEPEEEAEEPEEEAAPVEEEAAPAETEAPAETTTPAPATGNTAVATVFAVMAVAGAAAIVAKKRK